ncbi:hypothetical protein ACTA71_012356 [Dictyostelium dimigraforme]
MINYWSLYRQKFHPIHNKLTSLPDCIRNSKDKPLELKEIYNQLIKVQITHHEELKAKRNGMKDTTYPFQTCSWPIETLDISRYNRTEKVFPNLIGMVIHQIWKIICFKLFNDDENKLEPKFKFQVIDSELNNLIEIEKFITLKKINHEEAILRNTNQDFFKYRFNKSWQTPADPNPLPI